MNEPTALCELCGHPMPPTEVMFKFHGFSGPCPAPPLPKSPTEVEVEVETLRARIAELEIDRDAYAASARQARTECDALQARLSLAEAVCKEALTEPFQSDELVEALAAWREGGK